MTLPMFHVVFTEGIKSDGVTCTRRYVCSNHRLIDGDVVDNPFRISKDVSDTAKRTSTTRLTGKVGRIRDHLRARTGAVRIAIGGPGPAPTKGGIDDHRMIVEIIGNIAIVSTPETCRRTPARRYGCLGGDVPRNVSTSKVPHRHARRRVPQKRKDTASDRVEPGTKRIRGGVHDGAARIGRWGAVAIRGEDLARERLGVRLDERASIRRPAVERHLVVWLVVDTLDDIDLSPRGPVRSIGLQSTENQPTRSMQITEDHRRTQMLGHVPQPTGIAATSRINKPPLYCLFDVMRTLPTFVNPSTRGQTHAMAYELRFPPAGTLLVESTAITKAFPCVYARF